MKKLLFGFLAVASVSSFAQIEPQHVSPEWQTINGRKFCAIQNEDLAFYTVRNSSARSIIVRKLSSGNEQRYDYTPNSSFDGHTFKLVTENKLGLPKYMSRTANQYGSDHVGFFELNDLEWKYLLLYNLSYFDSSDGFIERCR